MSVLIQRKHRFLIYYDQSTFTTTSQRKALLENTYFPADGLLPYYDHIRIRWNDVSGAFYKAGPGVWSLDLSYRGQPTYQESDDRWSFYGNAFEGRVIISETMSEPGSGDCC